MNERMNRNGSLVRQEQEMERFKETVQAACSGSGQDLAVERGRESRRIGGGRKQSRVQVEGRQHPSLDARMAGG